MASAGIDSFRLRIGCNELQTIKFTRSNKIK
nr:MAG TPA: hypothetical protein [Bacteriophage sp.]